MISPKNELQAHRDLAGALVSGLVQARNSAGLALIASLALDDKIALAKVVHALQRACRVATLHQRQIMAPPYAPPAVAAPAKAGGSLAGQLRQLGGAAEAMGRTWLLAGAEQAAAEMRPHLERAATALGSRDVRLAAPDADCPEAPGRPGEVEVAPRPTYRYDPMFARRKMHQQLFNIEVCATEICAMILARFPEIPLGAADALATQCLEEARHAEVLLGSLQAEGGRIGETPISLGIWNGARREATAAACLGVEQVIGEGFAIGSDLFYSEFYRSKGRDDLSAQYATLHIDEVNHARHGLKWFRILAGGDADALLLDLEARTKTAPLAGRFFVPEVRRYIGFTETEIDRQRLRAVAPSVEID